MMETQSCADCKHCINREWSSTTWTCRKSPNTCRIDLITGESTYYTIGLCPRETVFEYQFCNDARGPAATCPNFEQRRLKLWEKIIKYLFG
jgi:hypothetical protein